MSILIFENSGEIDPLTICTFGVSVKEGSNPIGFFGTGLKYAIAILLRTGHTVTICSGERVMRMGTERREVRGAEFDVVTMTEADGTVERLGFTTEVGKNWQVWQAYRELACNCKDEGGLEFVADYPPDPEAGKTLVIVDGEQVVAAHHARADYILQTEPLFAVEDVEVRAGPGNGFYFRGILVHRFPSPARYIYNVTSRVELTEDRTLKYSWDAESAIRRAMLGATQPEFLRETIGSHKTYREGAIDVQGYGIQPTPEFLRAVADLEQRTPQQCNPTAMVLLREHVSKQEILDEIHLTAVEAAMLKRALDFCECLGFKVSQYPLVAVESLGESVLGRAKDGTIYIARRVFEQGAKQIASTVIEEFTHLSRGYEDCTYQMQTYLFDKIVTLGEELIGEPL